MGLGRLQGMKLKSSKVRIYSWLLAVGWTLVLAVSFLTGKSQQDEHTVQVATAQAHALYEDDAAIRKWATGHGGVYVPVTEETPPSPYLAHIPNRDLELPSGLNLTLLNPAYMIRQLQESMAEFKSARSKITSLNPLRPGNAPDGWERRALQQLEVQGAEVSEIQTIDGAEYLRFMRPLYVADECLKCHGHQAYKVGDLRGGVGIAVRLEVLQAVARETVLRQLWVYLILWGLGLVGIMGGARLLAQKLVEQEQLARSLQEALEATEAIIDNVPFGIVIVGRDKIVQRINKRGLEIISRTEAEVAGRICHDNICPTLVGHCPVLDEHRQLDNSPREALRSDGSTVPIHKTVIPYHYQGEDVLLEAFIDMTEQTRKSEELLATVEELQRFNGLAVGRELRMTELKTEVNALLDELKRQPRYAAREHVVPGGDA